MSNKFEALKQHVENSDSGSGEEENVNNITDLGPVEYPPNEHKLEHPYCLWFSRRPNLNARTTQTQGTQGYSQALRLVGQIATVEQWWALYSHIVRLPDLPPHTDLHLFKKGIQPMWEDVANSKGGKWVIRLRKGLAARAWENLCMAMLGEQFMEGVHKKRSKLSGPYWKTRFNELDFMLKACTESVRQMPRLPQIVCLNLRQTWLHLKPTSHASLRLVNLSGVARGLVVVVAGNEICGVVVSIRYQEDLLSIWNRTSSDQFTTSRIRDALKRLLNLPPNTPMEYKTHNDSLKNVFKAGILNNLEPDIFPVFNQSPEPF